MRFRFSITSLIRVVLAFTFIVNIPGMSSPAFAQAQGNQQISFEQFDLLTASQGWVLVGQRLFWTSDAGQTWHEIGPSIPTDAVIQDVAFIESDTGWMLWTTARSEGIIDYQLAQTADNGITWTIQSLALFEPGEIASNAEKAEMDWFDAQTGWISVKQNSSSNFSLGTLFTTSDGGKNWSRSALPVADRVNFSDPHTGWAVGGPANDQVFHTQDEGANWESIQPANIPENVQTIVYPPHYANGQGALVTTHVGPENTLNVYALESSLDGWQPVAQVELDVQPGVIGLSVLDPQNFVAVIPGTTAVVRTIDGELTTLENTDGHSASIVELDTISLDVGWAKAVDADCDAGADSVSCSSTTSLLQTTDGGITWEGINLPGTRSGVISSDSSNTSSVITASAAAATENTEIFTGQGFDRCEIPTLSQMQSWWNSSPYKTVNLYVGGSSRACANSVLSSSYLFQLNKQGWKFFPTWVGPQAPCTGYPNRMSSDVTTAYQQGVTQANLAMERLAELGLTGPPKTGSVVYYDIEPYGTDTNCRAAVNAFMNGWVSQLHVRESLAGVYGSTLCNTALSDFRTIANIPDLIWPARWYHNLGEGYYDPDASVWNLGSCIPNSVWADHQRIRQYEGDHHETWGSLTLDIDSNVLDGVVAIPYDYPHVSSIVRMDADPNNASTVRFTVSFSKAVTGVNKGDFALTTNGITGASISSVSGSGTTYTVTVGTGSGEGTLRLDVVDNDSIEDSSGNALGGSGAGNGNFSFGESYTITSTTFVDVRATHMFYPYIEAFYREGITAGCSQSPRLYCPDNPVTRGEMAVFLERAVGNLSPNPDPSGMFTDVQAGNPFKPFIEQLYNDGITGGCSLSPLQYCPQSYVTRGQMAVFIERAMGNFSPDPDPAGMFTDVLSDDPFKPFIEELYNDRITGGCNLSPLMYCPQSYVTRGQMAVFMVKAFAIPLSP
jgi:photosystem II stability/assembly factor-like uncharacterized protein